MKAGLGSSVQLILDVYRLYRLHLRCQVHHVQSEAVDVRWPYSQGFGCSRRVTGSSLRGNSIFNSQYRLISDLPEERGSPYL